MRNMFWATILYKYHGLNIPERHCIFQKYFKADLFKQEKNITFIKMLYLNKNFPIYWSHIYGPAVSDFGFMHFFIVFAFRKISLQRTLHEHKNTSFLSLSISNVNLKNQSILFIQFKLFTSVNSVHHRSHGHSGFY